MCMDAWMCEAVSLRGACFCMAFVSARVAWHVSQQFQTPCNSLTTPNWQHQQQRLEAALRTNATLQITARHSVRESLRVSCGRTRAGAQRR